MQTNADKIIVSDIKKVCDLNFIDWNRFKNKIVMITGITGLIGSFFAKVFIAANEKYSLNLKIIGIVRDVKKAENLLSDCLGSSLKLINQDINNDFNYKEKIDFIIHCANNTDSKSFVEKPIETIDIAVNGTKNVLEFAKKKNVESVLFLSSMEVYGQTDKELLNEEDLGYIDLFDLRNSYSMGKRMAEMLCYSYSKKENLPVKIARLSQIIAPSANYNDNRVVAYFARCIVENQDITLKTTGETIRSFCYITDVISAMITILLKGKNSEVYNVNNEKYTQNIKELAEFYISKSQHSKLKIELEKTNYYPLKSNWALSSNKLKSLGWHPTCELNEAVFNLISTFQFKK